MAGRAGAARGWAAAAEEVGRGGACVATAAHGNIHASVNVQCCGVRAVCCPPGRAIRLIGQGIASSHAVACGQPGNHAGGSAHFGEGGRGEGGRGRGGGGRGAGGGGRGAGGGGLQAAKDAASLALLCTPHEALKSGPVHGTLESQCQNASCPTANEDPSQGLRHTLGQGKEACSGSAAREPQVSRPRTAGGRGARQHTGAWHAASQPAGVHVSSAGQRSTCQRQQPTWEGVRAA